MMSKSKVPQIRFKGFSGEWKESELGKKVEFFTGLTYSPHNVIKDNGTLVLRSSNVKNGQIVDADNVYVNSDVVNCSNVLKGDIAVVVRNGSRSLIGKHAQIQKEMKNTVIGAFMTGIRSEQPSFINALLDSPKFYKEIEKNLGATINQITTGAFKKMTFSFSDYLEQTKIGNYFQKLDKLIEQKEKKYQKLKQFKKAMLDKMFPKNGADTPEIRFKGFNGKWEEKSLEEIVDRYDNLRIPISASNRIAGDTPYYGANGIQDYVQGFTHDGEFILVAEDGANDLKNYPVQYVNGKIWVNNHAHVLQAKKDISSNKFFKYSISKINIEPFLVGGGRAKLNANIMMKINIYVPLNLQEQEKIGNYFYKLDNQIDLQQKELEKLKNIKKASLAKMFV